MTDISPKPQPGTVAPVEVQPWYKHASIVITSIVAAIPLILAVLVQFQQLPGLPTNIEAWIGSAIAILTAVFVAYQKIFGTPMITPTAASKVIETNPNK